jgi:hypothetical protein
MPPILSTNGATSRGRFFALTGPSGKQQRGPRAGRSSSLRLLCVGRAQIDADKLHAIPGRRHRRRPSSLSSGEGEGQRQHGNAAPGRKHSQNFPVGVAGGAQARAICKANRSTIGSGSMKRYPVTAACGIILCALMGTATQADPEGCKDAILQNLNSARVTVDAALNTYGACIYSDGHGDCSRQFSGVKSAFAAFESAASAYENECVDKLRPKPYPGPVKGDPPDYRERRG